MGIEQEYKVAQGRAAQGLGGPNTTGGGASGRDKATLQSVLNTEEEQIVALNEVVSALEQRLDPVMEQIPSADSAANKTPFSSGIVGRIEQNTASVSFVRYRLSTILQRLQL